MADVERNDKTFRVEREKEERAERSRVLKYNDKTLEKLDEYEYVPLKDQKRRIRLLRLLSSGLENPLIDCELIEVEFSDKYAPIRVQPGVKSDGTGHVVDYEALSWCWGKENRDYAIRIRDEEGVQYKLPAKRELVLALKYLRRPHRDRTIWIDAICIDQSNHLERNHQVQMMAMIYTRAEKVCVWLGEDDRNSNMAIQFICEEIMNLERFDSICKNKANADKWQALLSLMQRPWFRRRWVVQEIALSRRAKVYCGKDKILWKDFAVAVELFVEVESATHRLSEVMQKDERFFHVPGWFEYVSQLGASLLVDATGKVFRATETRRGGAKETDQRIRAPQNTTKPEPVEVRTQDEMRAVQDKGPPQPVTITDTVVAPPAVTHPPVAESNTVTADTTNDHSQNHTQTVTTLDDAQSESSTKTALGNDEAGDKTEATMDAESDLEGVTVDPLGRRGLLSLEYLVSTLSTFEATEPRDAIYSLLAIARDTTPFAEVSAYRSDKSNDSLVMSTLSSFLERKPYRVDYSLPYSDVCKDFISFCIERSHALDPSRSLDILCRPWAPPQPRDEAVPTKGRKGKRESVMKKKKKAEDAARKSKLAEVPQGKGVYHNGERVKLREARVPEDGWKRTVVEGGNLVVKPDTRDLAQFRKDITSDKLDPVILKYFPASTTGEEGAEKSPGSVKDIDLPTWVASIEGAPFSPFKHPGMHILKTGRKNADSLVGLPEDGHRNYSAAQTQRPEDRNFKLRFKKRPILGHYSLYVRGFILDEVAEVTAPAYGGNIPKAWTVVGNWHDLTIDPPDDFLRTIVADRGKGNRNPPYYYAKACRESISKGSIESGRVNLEALINSEQNSIITEFCRRVQEVIWNRRLIKTERGILGLAGEHVKVGDLVCIIYGCSVPVILRQHSKAKARMEATEKKPCTTSRNGTDSHGRGGFEDQGWKDFSEAMEKWENLKQMTRVDEEHVSQDGDTEGGGGQSAEEKRKAIEQAEMAVFGSFKVVKSIWPKLKDELVSKEADLIEEARKKALHEALEEEAEEDRAEILKAIIRKQETRLVQKARYRELMRNGFPYNKTKDSKRRYTGKEYEDYIKKATKIVNEYLEKLEKIKKSKEKEEKEATEKLAKESEGLQKAGDGSERTEKELDDTHYYYQHFGEGYIHGMMDGEAIREKFRRKISQTVFELR